MKKILYTISLASLLLVCSQIQAAGISVTPDKLSVQTYVKGEVERDLYIKNISSGPVIYNLYAEELVNEITIQPDFIRLEASETQRIKISVRI